MLYQSRTVRKFKTLNIILQVCAFRKWIVLQSEPLLDNPYAKMLPSSLKLLLVIATVPSSERVLGSRNTLGSLSRVSCTYKTLKKYPLSWGLLMYTYTRNLNYTFGFANQYFYKSNIFRHVWQGTNILENPTIASNDREYCHALYMPTDTV